MNIVSLDYAKTSLQITITQVKTNRMKLLQHPDQTKTKSLQHIFCHIFYTII